jgi:hypothetical protein
MLPENKYAIIYKTGWVTGSGPQRPAAPGEAGIWTYGLPAVTWKDTEQASRAHRNGGIPRRVPRRADGNGLPLIGLRPACKLKRQPIGPGVLPR